MSYYTSANTQDDLLLQNLMNFYDKPENMKTIQTIVNGESRVSLRIIDWFVTNYAKKYETEYKIQMRTGILKDLIENCAFKVYHRYKLQLKAYSKKRFDPFCRWDRISIPCGNLSNGEEEYLMETTIGQLNFFKWAIENRILDYIEMNYTEIENDMNSTLKQRETEKKSTNFMEVKSIKRKELSVPGNKSVHITRISAVIKFV